MTAAATPIHLIPGTPQDGTSGRTVEQDAKLAQITVPATSLVRTEFRGYLLAPNGSITNDLSILVIPPARADELALHLDQNARLGSLLALNADGECVGYLECMPTVEAIDEMLADPDILDSYPGLSVDVLKLWRPSAPTAADVAALTVAVDATSNIIASPVAETAVSEDAPEAPAAPIIPPAPDPSSLHLLDGQPSGTVVTKLDDQQISVANPGASPTVHPVAPDDPIAILPAGSTITNVDGRTTIDVAHPVTGESWYRAAGDRLHDALVKLWSWIHTELAKL